MKYNNCREEELKQKVAKDYFGKFDCTRIIGNVDFCVSAPSSNKDTAELQSLLWAEAKKGSSDIFKSIAQLVLTIGKERTFDKFIPPTYLGAFDGEKIAFVPYNEIQEVFYFNDFNWNVAPSNHNTREFQLVHNKVKSIIQQKALLFFFQKDDKEIKEFIKSNFVLGKSELSKIKIDKNNFIFVYNKWLQAVKPTIAVNWEIAKKKGIIDGDFYLADLLSQDNLTLKEKLFVLLKKDHYELDRKIDETGMFTSKRADFIDNQVAHKQFWNKYERPPKEEYWDYIVNRRDLLVPQDIRELKGSFFTPQQWVELSQKYLANALGEDWQEEYYVWDCAAGTGNLLAGLTNKYNIWASTIDQQDVDIMHDRINNGANLLHDHVFQFDFLNDDFLPKSKGGKIPDNLYKIITNPEERKKMVIYINPPYKRGLGVAYTKMHKVEMGEAKDELYIQFLYRIYKEINGCKIGVFSKLKLLNAPDFATMRNLFKAKLVKLFVVPAYTFDNVKGKFPIGFQIYDTSKTELFSSIIADVYDENGKFIKTKTFSTYNNSDFINKWLKMFKTNQNLIGYLNTKSNDFQHQNRIVIGWQNILSRGDFHIGINKDNLKFIAIYFAVRHCIEANWLNDRDQFLYPNDGWKQDIEFQNDCLAFTLFHNQNKISSKHGVNHWIPFTEAEVDARDRFDSHFMADFIKGKIKVADNDNLFNTNTTNPFTNTPNPSKRGEQEVSSPFPEGTQGVFINRELSFSPEAQAVFDAGRELWKYYHSKPNVNVNASLYDIREYFQGRNQQGSMNTRSSDETYNKLITNLRDKLKLLAKKIEPKVYEYGFLRK